MNGLKPYETTNLKIRDSVPFLGNHLAQRGFSNLFPIHERKKHTYIV